MLTSSIIICTKDRKDDLERCLGSLLEQSRAADELIVVDGGEDHAGECVRAFGEKAPKCHVVYLHSEPGLTKQRNLGIRHATQAIVHFLDDDVILDWAYVEEIQKTFETPDADGILAVAPMLGVPRPVKRSACRYRRVFMLPQIDGDGRMQPSGFGTYTWYANYADVHPIEVGCGCCAFRREVFGQIQFDEWFEGYSFMEDLDFTYRVGRLGPMVGNPRARMLHVETPADRMDWRRLTKMQIVNHHYVFKKLLPQRPRNWLCFWWSEFGFGLLRLRQMMAARDLGVGMGMLEGYLFILAWPLRYRMGTKPSPRP